MKIVMDVDLWASEIDRMDDDLQWIRDGLAKPGKTQTGLAKALGRAPSAVTALLKGGRELRAREIPVVAGYLGVEPPDLAESSIVPLVGRIGAGAEIEPDFEQVPPEGLEDIALPFPLAGDMIAFEVIGDSMLPGFEAGDVIIVRRDGPPDAGALHGRVAAVRTDDGRRYLKRVIVGPTQQVGYGQMPTFHLESVNAAAGTIYNVRLEWASPVSFTAKAAEVRKIAKSSRRPTTAAEDQRPSRRG